MYDRTGITNECQDGMYVPFFDFEDNPPTTLPQITTTIMGLQDEWALSTAYVIESTPHQSYRAFTFDKVDFRECIGILADCDYLDPNYLRSFVRRRKSVLRVIPKRERGDHDRPVDIIPKSSVIREKSYDHEQFFRRLFFGLQPTSQHPSPIHVTVSRYESFR